MAELPADRNEPLTDAELGAMERRCFPPLSSERCCDIAYEDVPRLLDEVRRLKGEAREWAIAAEAESRGRVKAEAEVAALRDKPAVPTHDCPATFEAVLERLRRCDGTHCDATIMVWDRAKVLVGGIDRLVARDIPDADRERILALSQRTVLAGSDMAAMVAIGIRQLLRLPEAEGD